MGLEHGLRFGDVWPFHLLSLSTYTIILHNFSLVEGWSLEDNWTFGTSFCAQTTLTDTNLSPRNLQCTTLSRTTHPLFQEGLCHLTHVHHDPYSYHYGVSYQAGPGYTCAGRRGSHKDTFSETRLCNFGQGVTQ